MNATTSFWPDKMAVTKSDALSKPSFVVHLIVRFGLVAGSVAGASGAFAEGIATTDVPTAATASAPSLAATIAAMPKGLPRSDAPPLAAAVSAAEAAERFCAAKGAKVSVLIADTAGEPVVLLSGDGAGVRSQLIARTKAHIVAVYKMPSGDVAERAKSDPKLANAAAADPNIGMLRAGGYPIMRAGKMIGIAAVSGGSLGGDMHLDEACARVAVENFGAR